MLPLSTQQKSVKCSLESTGYRAGNNNVGYTSGLAVRMETPGIQNTCGCWCTPATVERRRLGPGTVLGLGRLAGMREVEVELGCVRSADTPAVPVGRPVSAVHLVVGWLGPERHADGLPQPCGQGLPPSCEPSTPCESP